MRTIASTPAALPFTLSTLADLREEALEAIVAEMRDTSEMDEDESGLAYDREYVGPCQDLDRDLEILASYLEDIAA